MITPQYGYNVKSWVLDNLDFIRKQPDSKPKGHKGVIFGMKDLQLPHQKRLLIENGFPYNDLKAIEEELINHYKIRVGKYAYLGIMLLYAEEGYKCTWHTDDTDDENIYTTRFNVLLSKPEKGGEPIIKKGGEKITIPVQENEPWLCIAGKYEHSTVKTKGSTPRILLSFGYDISKVLLENIEER